MLLDAKASTLFLNQIIELSPAVRWPSSPICRSRGRPRPDWTT